MFEAVVESRRQTQPPNSTYSFIESLSWVRCRMAIGVAGQLIHRAVLVARRVVDARRLSRVARASVADGADRVGAADAALTCRGVVGAAVSTRNPSGHPPFKTGGEAIGCRYLRAHVCQCQCVPTCRRPERSHSARRKMPWSWSHPRGRRSQHRCRGPARSAGNTRPGARRNRCLSCTGPVPPAQRQQNARVEPAAATGVERVWCPARGSWPRFQNRALSVAHGPSLQAARGGPPVQARLRPLTGWHCGARPVQPRNGRLNTQGTVSTPAPPCSDSSSSPTAAAACISARFK
jgi:hypothetical protein